MMNRSGFTLLELVATLSLASALAGIGALSHQALRPRLDLMAAMRHIVMDLQATRMRAVAHNTTYRLVFSVGSNRYWLQRQSGGAYTDDGPPIALPAGIIIADCTAQNAAISFRPRGNAGTFGTVTVRNTDGDSRSIVVNITGHVRVQ
jgi:prepilin-type N-terminal cleavage/methylation domain-containing protein